VGADDVIAEDLTVLLHQVAGIGLLHLSDTDWQFHVVRQGPELWQAFRGLLTFSMWIHEHGRPEAFIAGTRRRELTDP
jgi:hypothetical protein